MARQSLEDLDALPVAVYTCDRSGVITGFNELAVEAWGRRPNVGDPDERFCGSWRIYAADGTFVPHSATPMAEVLRSGKPVRNREAMVERPDGSRIRVLVNISPLRDDSGKQIGAINCFHEITRLECIRETENRELALRTEAARANERLELILSAVDEHLVMFDRDWRYVYVNGSATKMLGKKPEELLGRCIWDVFPEAVNNPFYHDLHRAAQKQEIIHSEHFYAPWGKWIENHIYPVAEGVAVLARDITERKRTEEALRVSEHKLQLAMAAARMGVWEWNIRTGEVTWSTSLEQIHGLNSSAFGGTFEDFKRDIHPEDLERVMSQIQTAVEQRAAYHTLYRLCRPDGQIRWVEAFGKLSPENEPAEKMVGVCMDVTERQQTEQALSVSEERFRLAACSKAITLYEQDRELRYTWLYPVHPEHSHALGKSDLEMLPGAAGQQAIEWKKEVMATGVSQRREIQSGPESGWRYYDVFIEPRRDAAGNVIGVAGAALDITDRKLAEIERKRAEESLERAVAERTASLQEAISQMEEFSYSVSHDLRAPLRAMEGYASALLEDFGNRLDAQGRDYLERIVRSGSRMDRLIQDLLIYGRLARGEVHLVPVRLDKLIREIVHQFILPQSPNARVTVNAPDMVMGHEPSLMQAVSNLLSNAAKFIPPGAIPHIRVWTERRGDRVRLWVADNGIGIKAEHQMRLFGLFERVHPNGPYEGTGIGLAIVRKAAERMDGKAGVESDGVNGCRFWLELAAPIPI